jgi:membrane protease YdiL (CAAX protease family)
LGVFIGLYVFRNAYLAIVIYHIGLVLAILLFRKGSPLQEGFKIKSKKTFFISSFIFSFSGFGLYFFWESLKIPELDLETVLLEYGLNQSTFWIFVIYISTVNPLLEELFWRFIYKSNSKIVSASDLLFAFFHFFILIKFTQIEYAILATVGLVLTARIWRYYHSVLKENLTIFITHALADLSIMIAVLLLIR